MPPLYRCCVSAKFTSMEWNDEGIILSTRPHGENAAIAMVLTAQNGRHAGLIQGGQGRKAALLQPGNRVKATWRGRLLDHLGTYTLETEFCPTAHWLDDPEILNIISACCAVTATSLPERQPMPGVFAAMNMLMTLTDRSFWGPAYVRWEIGLLKALGYGLDLERCAVSATTENLTHVSPRTGRAVCANIATNFDKKLLKLPAFLNGSLDWSMQDILTGLELTGHFLARHIYAIPHHQMMVASSGELPPARSRLAAFYKTAIQN